MLSPAQRETIKRDTTRGAVRVTDRDLQILADIAWDSVVDPSSSNISRKLRVQYGEGNEREYHQIALESYRAELTRRGLAPKEPAKITIRLTYPQLRQIRYALQNNAEAFRDELELMLNWTDQQLWWEEGATEAVTQDLWAGVWRRFWPHFIALSQSAYDQQVAAIRSSSAHATDVAEWLADEQDTLKALREVVHVMQVELAEGRWTGNP